jgi:hypothetical protein
MKVIKKSSARFLDIFFVLPRPSVVWPRRTRAKMSFLDTDYTDKFSSEIGLLISEVPVPKTSLPYCGGHR